MQLEIRPATPGDAKGIVDVLNPIIAARVYTVFDTPFTVEAERDYIHHFPPRGVFLVALNRADDAVVGFQSMEPFASYTRAFDHVGVLGTYVDLRYRRQGIATRLFDATLAAALLKGYEKVFTFVRADNPAALQTYLRQGFQTVGIARRHARIDGRYVDEVVIEKIISCKTISGQHVRRAGLLLSPATGGQSSVKTRSVKRPSTLAGSGTRPSAPGLRYIALLRAINVGGHIVRMEHLRERFQSLGFSNVETFIASGNVIFDTSARNAKALEKKIENDLHTWLGYQVRTFIRSPSEVAEIARYEAFGPAEFLAEGNSLYIAFLPDPPAPAARDKLLSYRTSTDDLHVHGREVYWLCRTKLGESAFSGARMEKTLGLPATIRNVTTIRRLAMKYSALAAASSERPARS